MGSKEFETLLTSLTTDTDCIQTKLNVYKEIQTYLHNQTIPYTLGEKLVMIIKQHLKEDRVVEEALHTWIFYVRKSKCLSGDVIEAVYIHLKTFDKMMPLFSELLTENSLDIQEVLTNSDTPMNKQILDALSKISDSVSTKVYLDFINNKVVKAIFDTNSDEIRNILVDFVLSKLDLFSVMAYSIQERRLITSTFKNSYVAKIEHLRVENNNNWYKLCIFTMKYCGKLLHSDIELTNSILRNVEIGFKTKTIQDRLMSYECWKVLIDNCNLDSNYICNAKQLRLLIKPLNLKLSKNDEIIRKRFDIWFYLMQLLGEKLLLCLEDFLRFCFELPNNNTLQSEILIESDIIKDTWMSRIEALMNIIGHFDHKEGCIESKNCTIKDPIINSSNYLNFDSIIISCIYTACKIIVHWDNNGDKKIKVKCLWGSLFKIIQHLPENSKESILHKVSKIISLLLQDCQKSKNYFEDILVPIFSLLTSLQEPICNSLLLNEIIIFPIVRFMLSQETVKIQWTKELVDLVKNVPKTGNKLFYFNRVCELFRVCSYKSNSFAVHLWLQLAEELYGICKTPTDGFTDFKDDAMFFLMWIFHCSDLVNMQNEILSIWLKIFAEICTISNIFGEDLLCNCEKFIKKHPDRINNLLTFLPDISLVLTERKSSKRYALPLLSVTYQCLQNPCTPKDKVILTLSVLKKVLNLCYNSDGNDSIPILSKIFECVECLLKPHQVYEILEVFKAATPNLSNGAKTQIPNSLKDIFKELSSNSDFIVSQDASAVLEQLELEESTKVTPPPFVRPSVSTRSAKIANMIRDSPKQSMPRGSLLKMFSKEKTSPSKKLKPKLNSPASPSPRTKKLVSISSKFFNKINSIDDDSSEFVPIDKEVKLDKSKLSDHQKEMLGRRRTDIPALYQDLSQSQNNSIDCSSNSNDILQNKLDLSLNDNFKDIISDLKKAGDMLQKSVDADLVDVPHISKGICSNDNSEEKTVKRLPKCDLNISFEKVLESKELIDKIDQVTNTTLDTDKSTPVICFSKLEEKKVSDDAAQAPDFPERNIDDLKLQEKDCKRKCRTKLDKNVSMDSEVCNEITLTETKSNLIDNRSSSDSILEKNANSRTKIDSVEKKKSPTNQKQSKSPRAKVIKNKFREKHKKHLISNKQLSKGRHRRKSCDETLIRKCQIEFDLKRKYKSLENLDDMHCKYDGKKGKKCFKIIQNNAERSNSIKLRISITEEKDTNTEDDLIDQLDAEISKIDANLKKSPRYSDELTQVSSEDILKHLNQTKLTIPKTPQLVNTDTNRLSKLEVQIEIDSANTEERTIIQTSENISTKPIKKKTQRELERIKMDIVGAEEFLVTTPRKRRASRVLNSAQKESPTTNKVETPVTSRKKINKQDNNLNDNMETSQTSGKEKKDILTCKESDATPNSDQKSMSSTRRNRKRRITDEMNTPTTSEDIRDDNTPTKTATDKSEPSTNLETSFTANTTPHRSDRKTRSRRVNVNSESDQDAPKDIAKAVAASNNLTNSSSKSGKKTLNKSRKSLPKKMELAPRKTARSKSKGSVLRNAQEEKEDENKNPIQESLPIQNSSSIVEEKLLDANTVIKEELSNSEDVIESTQQGDIIENSQQEDIIKNSQQEVIIEDSQQENIIDSIQETVANTEEDIKPVMEHTVTYITNSIKIIETHIEENRYNLHNEDDLQDHQESPDRIISHDIPASHSEEVFSNNVPENSDSIWSEMNNEEIKLENCEITGDVKPQNLCENIDQEHIEPIDSSPTVSIVPSENIILNDGITQTCDPYMDTEDNVCLDSKSDIVRRDEHATETCDPYMNIENEEDVIENLKSSGQREKSNAVKEFDFDSLPLGFDTPKKESIPSSPVCDDTPNRNNELLKNTLNISPIRTQHVAEEVLEKDTLTLSEKFYVKKPSSRFAKILNLLPGNGETTPIKTSRSFTKKVSNQPDTASPSTQRVRKMIMNCGKLETTANRQEDSPLPTSSVPQNNNLLSCTVLEDNVLKFIRELPSPFATPNSSILKKRKIAEITDDSISPYAKRQKRVNFSDPPTTSQKIYFTENEQSEDVETSVSLMSGLNLMKANCICPQLSDSIIDIKEIVLLLNQDLINHFHSINIRTVGDLADLNENQVNQLEFLTEPRLSRITDALQEINSACRTKDTDLTDNVTYPIYPELIDCTDSIQNILKFIGNGKTSKEFRLKNIATIGDLAKLTKSDVTQLCIKMPIVIKTLQKYERRLNKSKMLAKQLEEEMNEENSDLDEANVTTNKDTYNVTVVRKDKMDTSCGANENKVDDETTIVVDDDDSDIKSIDKKKTLDAEIQHITDTYDINEIRKIFDGLKNVIFAHNNVI